MHFFYKYTQIRQIARPILSQIFPIAIVQQWTKWTKMYSKWSKLNIIRTWRIKQMQGQFWVNFSQLQCLLMLKCSNLIWKLDCLECRSKCSEEELPLGRTWKSSWREEVFFRAHKLTQQWVLSVHFNLRESTGKKAKPTFFSRQTYPFSQPLLPGHFSSKCIFVQW